MSEPHRLVQGGRIRRDRPLQFRFDGRTLQGCQGDTLASALLANGKGLIARSWKYHRPRGIVAAGVEEPNALVQLGEGPRTVPNARATEVELYQGLSAHSVNAWPSVDFDAMGLANAFGRFLPAGFYYKTFMWPASAWKGYERAIRRAAGFGTAPSDADPDRYDKTYAHCDVLIAGGGPAGLMAALTAGRSGARVLLVDEQAELGGGLLGSSAAIDGIDASQWLAASVAEVAQLPEVRVLTRSTVFGYHDQNFLTIVERCHDHLPQTQRTGVRERVWRVRAKEVILATGAHERPLVFADNDLPGVMLASALATYIRRYGVLPGRRLLVATNNDSAYEAALAGHAAGASVVVVDVRPEPSGAVARLARASGLRVIGGSVVVQAHGRSRVQAAAVARFQPAEARAKAERIDCDVLAMSSGWSPAVHLHSQAGGRVQWDGVRACFVPGVSTQRNASVGAAAGTLSLGGALREGAAAGARAASACGFAPTRGYDMVDVAEDDVQALLPLWRVPGPWAPGRGPKAFVDLQNDVTVSDILLAAREGYASIEHVKRYTALGFGTDQGKLGNINGMAILAEALHQSIEATGTTTFRPNYTPVTFGAIAGPDLGELFEPVRKTALHAWHAAQGARFEDVGQWKRPWYYPRGKETMHEAVHRECLAVRNAVGLLDASTLGKIDIQGPDAAKLLDWVYTNGWSKLAVGRCRYGLMLGEDGMVMDDGVTTRLAERHYLMSTTTGGAARVLNWMESWLQTEWPHLEVFLTSVTEHWATLTIAGPSARAVLQAACRDVDAAASAFPFMSVREGSVAGVPARIMRISFSGELSYEINVGADFAQHVWDALLQAGKPFGIIPYGTEAMHVLRAEKGYIIVGQDTDGSVTPIDLGMQALLAADKDFLGRRSLQRADTRRAGRKQLVGLTSELPAAILPEGGQIVETSAMTPPVRMLGHVTSSYSSPILGRAIALALLEDGRARIGQRVGVAHHRGEPMFATVCSPVFYDPEGKRQHA